MIKKRQQILNKLNELAKQYDKKPTHHINSTPKRRIKKLHAQRSKLRGINYERHLKALRNQGIQR